MATAKIKAAPELPITPTEEVANVHSLFDHATALKAYDPIEAGLQVLRTRYGSIKIAGPDDNVNYQLAKEAVKDLTSRRTSLEAKRKELKADALEYGRKVDGKAKEIEAAIREIEDPIKKEVDRIDAEREAIKRAEETRRIGILNGAGFVLIGQTYQCGNVGDFFDNIMAMDEKAFGIFATNGAMERERLDKEEADRRRQMAEFEAKQKEMQELEAKLAAMKAQLATTAPEPMSAEDRGRWEAEQQTPSSAFANPRMPKPQAGPDIWAGEPSTSANTNAPQLVPMSQFGDYADKALGTNYGGNNPQQHTPAARQTWFNDGWEACKTRIIRIFTEDQTPRKRAEWVAIFQELKP